MPRARRDRAKGYVFYPDDYLNDPAVRRMGVMARGAYGGALLPALWAMPDPGVVEDDDALLASLAMCTAEEWAQVRDRVARAFDTTTRPGYWIQKRMVQQYAERQREYEAKRRAGRVGYKSRSPKEKATTGVPAVKQRCTRPQADLDTNEERGTRNYLETDSVSGDEPDGSARANVEPTALAIAPRRPSEIRTEGEAEPATHQTGSSRPAQASDPAGPAAVPDLFSRFTRATITRCRFHWPKVDLEVVALKLLAEVEREPATYRNANLDRMLVSWVRTAHSRGIDQLEADAEAVIEAWVRKGGSDDQG